MNYSNCCIAKLNVAIAMTQPMSIKSTVTNAFVQYNLFLEGKNF